MGGLASGSFFWQKKTQEWVGVCLCPTGSTHTVCSHVGLGGIGFFSCAERVAVFQYKAGEVETWVLSSGEGIAYFSKDFPKSEEYIIISKAPTVQQHKTYYLLKQVLLLNAIVLLNENQHLKFYLEFIERQHHISASLQRSQRKVKTYSGSLKKINIFFLYTKIVSLFLESNHRETNKLEKVSWDSKAGTWRGSTPLKLITLRGIEKNKNHQK